ncbi:reverse transcriptase domain-containing protein [Pseudonocardia alni]|uniref:reverse transcriptase domain-containing protein n=1 Tax=Pseudonocardia alni TaxID=33907 RepID=UPI001AD66B28|nr:reverse transcriptase domain-containing protein [Pseudonocardia alni]MBO4239798.1 hypothetical protein [Pseudonocardia alni]
MASFDWLAALDIKQARRNLIFESHGDWHRDPWGWPELNYLIDKGFANIVDFCRSEVINEIALLDVPKESWGTRPAVVLAPVDRLAYQALTDSLSLDIAGDLSVNAYGWRLPAKEPKKGHYSHNNRQWDLYLGNLMSHAVAHPVALRTDIVSCFASMSINVVQAELDERTPSNFISKRLLSLLGSFDRFRDRSGLPQRSIASALIANMIMMTLDDVLEHYSSASPILQGETAQYHSFARWMDDMWLFVDDPGKARRAQIELQKAAESVGLYLNAAKTEVLEEGQAVSEVQSIEHSAVDGALNRPLNPDAGPLHELIDSILDAPEKTGRTSIKFAALRMTAHDENYRALELAEAAKRMPHAADALAPLFKEVFTAESLEEWFLDYVRSDWAGFEWTIAQYVRMFGKDFTPSDELIEYLADLVENPATSLPLLAAAAQRLSEWRPATAKTVIRAASRVTTNAHAVRVLSLAALNAGEPRRTVRPWITAHDANRAIAELLSERSFRALPVSETFRG